jgi:hypothetical protein
MTDIFKEVDEDIRREQLKKLWDRFGAWILGLAVVIVIATAGYRGWVYWENRQAEASGDKFVAATRLSGDNKHDEAIAAYEALVGGGSGGYPVLARFSVASEKARAGDTKGAVAEFDKIAADTTAADEVRTLARLRAAVLLADTATLPDLESRIGDLATTGNTWRLIAREMLGLAAWRTGEYAAARKYFDQVANDQETPQDMRQRSRLMLALLDARLGPEAPAAADGTAPAPAATDAPAAATPPATDAAPAPAAAD